MIEDFVAAAVEAVGRKRLPRSIPVIGKYTSIPNPNLSQPAPTSRGTILEILQEANQLVVMEGAGGSAGEPRFMVPFYRSGDFVGREDILKRLEEGFTPRRDYQPRMALWGLGGVG